jgi:hypothetical protein
MRSKTCRHSWHAAVGRYARLASFPLAWAGMSEHSYPDTAFKIFTAAQWAQFEADGVLSRASRSGRWLYSFVGDRSAVGTPTSILPDKTAL